MVMEIQIKKKNILIFLGLVILIALSYVIYQHFRPIQTIFIRGIPFSFRRDIRKALLVELTPKEELLNELFLDYKVKNITILFKPGKPETNALYQLETFEIAYKLTRYYEVSKPVFAPKKSFNAEPIDSYENITREDEKLKIILVPPEFSNQTRVVAGGNRIWIYGKTEKNFDFAVMKAILSVMNVSTTEGYV